MPASRSGESLSAWALTAQSDRQKLVRRMIGFTEVPAAGSLQVHVSASKRLTGQVFF
jgi:hypothetical protein